MIPLGTLVNDSLFVRRVLGVSSGQERGVICGMRLLVRLFTLGM